MSDHCSGRTAPWWRFGHVWLVLAGPAVVVVASFVTLYLAISRPETVIGVEPGVQTDTSEKRKLAPLAPSNLAPAMQARNHAATGVVPERP